MLYTIFVYPFELFLCHLLMFFHSVSGNYGAAILLISVTVSVLLYPVSLVVQRITNRPKRLMAEMQSHIDKINSLDISRSKKTAMLDSLYKQCGYSPLYLFADMLPLFVQLPFFIGMYKMVVNNIHLFSGQSFLFISDLSRPDGLLFGVNLLPILMTLINVLVAYIMPNADKKEFRQALILAGVFLILLYTVPSAAVLYWTFNNVITLGKYGLKYIQGGYPNGIRKKSCS